MVAADVPAFWMTQLVETCKERGYTMRDDKRDHLLLHCNSAKEPFQGTDTSFDSSSTLCDPVGSSQGIPAEIPSSPPPIHVVERENAYSPGSCNFDCYEPSHANTDSDEVEILHQGSAIDVSLPSVVTLGRKLGRKPKYNSDEERRKARLEQKAAYRARQKIKARDAKHRDEIAMEKSGDAPVYDMHGQKMNTKNPMKVVGMANRRLKTKRLLTKRVRGWLAKEVASKLSKVTIAEEMVFASFFEAVFTIRSYSYYNLRKPVKCELRGDLHPTVVICLDPACHFRVVLKSCKDKEPTEKGILYMITSIIEHSKECRSSFPLKHFNADGSVEDVVENPKLLRSTAGLLSWSRTLSPLFQLLGIDDETTSTQFRNLQTEVHDLISLGIFGRLRRRPRATDGVVIKKGHKNFYHTMMAAYKTDSLRNDFARWTNVPDHLVAASVGLDLEPSKARPPQNKVYQSIMLRHTIATTALISSDEHAFCLLVTRDRDLKPDCKDIKHLRYHILAGSDVTESERALMEMRMSGRKYLAEHMARESRRGVRELQNVEKEDEQNDQDEINSWSIALDEVMENNDDYKNDEEVYGYDSEDELEPELDDQSKKSAQKTQGSDARRSRSDAPASNSFEMANELKSRDAYIEEETKRILRQNARSSTKSAHNKVLDEMWMDSYGIPCSPILEKLQSALALQEGKPEQDFKLQFFMNDAMEANAKISRPLWALDATHSKYSRNCRYTILTCCASNGNNNYSILAAAIAPSESFESWMIFLTILKQKFPEMFEEDNPHRVSFISDNDKGIKKGVKSVFPTLHHFNCFFHVTQNVRKMACHNNIIFDESELETFKSLSVKIPDNGEAGLSSSQAKNLVKTVVAILASNRNKTIADKLISILPKLLMERSQGTFQLLTGKKGIKTWVAAYIDTPRFGHTTSNFCEAINSLIRYDRTKNPIRLVYRIFDKADYQLYSVADDFCRPEDPTRWEKHEYYPNVVKVLSKAQQYAGSLTCTRYLKKKRKDQSDKDEDKKDDYLRVYEVTEPEDILQTFFDDQNVYRVRTHLPTLPDSKRNQNKNENAHGAFALGNCTKLRELALGASLGKGKYLVNLEEKACTCNYFQQNQFPCPHALVAISKDGQRHVDDYIADFYKFDFIIDKLQKVRYTLLEPNTIYFAGMFEEVIRMTERVGITEPVSPSMTKFLSVKSGRTKNDTRGRNFDESGAKKKRKASEIKTVGKKRKLSADEKEKWKQLAEERKKQEELEQLRRESNKRREEEAAASERSKAAMVESAIFIRENLPRGRQLLDKVASKKRETPGADKWPPGLPKILGREIKSQILSKST